MSNEEDFGMCWDFGGCLGIDARMGRGKWRINKMSKNYEWYIETNVSKYEGKWIAIVNQKVVSVGEDAKKVYNEAKEKYREEKPSLAKVPTKDTLVLLVIR